MIRRKLMTVHMHLYAMPDYLDRTGRPLKLEDLRDHRLICQNLNVTQVSAGLRLVQELLTHEIPSTLTVNNYFGVLQAVRAGLGIGVLPNYVVEELPDMERVLVEVESAEVPVFLAFPEELRQSRRIAAFRDFVTEEIIALRKKMKADDDKPA